jgi:hypothetical protein
MIIRIVEALIVLFVLWVIVNVIDAVAKKVAHGGGFWGLSNWITREKQPEEPAKPKDTNKKSKP